MKKFRNLFITLFVLFAGSVSAFALSNPVAGKKYVAYEDDEMMTMYFQKDNFVICQIYEDDSLSDVEFFTYYVENNKIYIFQSIDDYLDFEEAAELVYNNKNDTLLMDSDYEEITFSSVDVDNTNPLIGKSFLTKIDGEKQTFTFLEDNIVISESGDFKFGSRYYYDASTKTIFITDFYYIFDEIYMFEYNKSKEIISGEVDGSAVTMKIKK